MSWKKRYLRRKPTSHRWEFPVVLAATVLLAGPLMLLFFGGKHAELKQREQAVASFSTDVGRPREDFLSAHPNPDRVLSVVDGKPPGGYPASAYAYPDYTDWGNTRQVLVYMKGSLVIYAFVGIDGRVKTVWAGARSARMPSQTAGPTGAR